jgi:hypothetical protein
MKGDDYFQRQAAMYWQLAQKIEDVFIKRELLDLAAVCEEVANNIEDRRTSGRPRRGAGGPQPTSSCTAPATDLNIAVRR